MVRGNRPVSIKARNSPGLLLLLEMQVGNFQARMFHVPLVRSIAFAWRMVAFIDIGAHPDINQIVIFVVTTRRPRLKMVNRQFSSSTYFRNAAIASSKSVLLAEGFMFGMRLKLCRAYA